MTGHILLTATLALSLAPKGVRGPLVTKSPRISTNFYTDICILWLLDTRHVWRIISFNFAMEMFLLWLLQIRKWSHPVVKLLVHIAYPLLSQPCKCSQGWWCRSLNTRPPPVTSVVQTLHGEVLSLCHQRHVALKEDAGTVTKDLASIQRIILDTYHVNKCLIGWPIELIIVWVCPNFFPPTRWATEVLTQMLCVLSLNQGAETQLQRLYPRNIWRRHR